MSLPAKIGLFFVFLVALAIGLVVYLQSQLTPEKVRETLLPLVESTVGRNVDVGRVQLGLFSGITVDNLSIKQLHRDEDDFISVRQVRLHYQFLPLLTGHFVVNDVVLDAPVISINRFADGSFNFSDLLPGAGRAEPSGPVREKVTSLSQDIFRLLVKEVSIIGGVVQYTDAYQNPKAPYRYRLDRLNLQIRDLTLDSSFPIDASVRFNEAQLDVSGHYDLSRHSGDLVLHLTPLDLVPLAPYYRKELPGKLGAGKLSLNLEVDFTPGHYSSKGKVSLDGLDLTLDRLADAPFKNTTLAADYSVGFSSAERLLEVSTLLVKLNDIGLSIDGDLNLSADSPYLNLNLWLQELDLRRMMASLPKNLIRDYQKYSFAGQVDGRIALQGPPGQLAELFQSARLSLNDVQVSTEQLRLGLNGEIAYRDGALKTTDLGLTYGNQSALLTLAVKRQGKAFYQGGFSLAADTLDGNELTGGGDGIGGHEGGDGLSRETEIGPFDLPVDLTGTVSIGKVLYRDLALENVTADARLRDNRLRLENIRAAVGNGRIRGNSSLDLGVRGLSYTGAVQVRDMGLGALYQGLYPEGQQNVSGILALDSTFGGYGTRKPTLLRALTAQGTAEVVDGSLRGFPVADAVAVFLGGEELRGLTFQSLTGRYQLVNGVISQGSSLTGSKVRMTSQGTIDLKGDLNLKVDSRVAPKVLRRSGTVSDVMASLTDEQGWGRIPLVVRGRLERPRVQPDTSAIEGMLLKRAKDKVADKISEGLRSDDAAQEGVRDLLDNTLNRLFGR